jgi:hypothetical protein
MIADETCVSSNRKLKYQIVFVKVGIVELSLSGGGVLATKYDAEGRPRAPQGLLITTKTSLIVSNP